MELVDDDLLARQLDTNVRGPDVLVSRDTAGSLARRDGPADPRWSMSTTR